MQASKRRFEVRMYPRGSAQVSNRLRARKFAHQAIDLLELDKG